MSGRPHPRYAPKKEKARRLIICGRESGLSVSSRIPWADARLRGISPLTLRRGGPSRGDSMSTIVHWALVSMVESWLGVARCYQGFSILSAPLGFTLNHDLAPSRCDPRAPRSKQYPRVLRSHRARSAAISVSRIAPVLILHSSNNKYNIRRIYDGDGACKR